MTASLIERVESAAEGSRELDREIGELTNASMRTSGDVVGLGYDRFTTSLDAALALAERVLPGWHCHIGDLPTSDDADHEPHHWFGALLYLPEPYVRDREDFMEHGATRPLALCAAILRAHEASK